MAKKSASVNKSQAIRELLAAQPKIGSKEAVAHLGEKGIKISDQLFYFVKGKLHGRKKRKQKMAVAVRKASVSSVDAVELIRRVRELAELAGGYDQLAGLVEALRG